MSDQVEQVLTEEALEDPRAFGILSEEQMEYIRGYLQSEITTAEAEEGRTERIDRNKIIDRQRQIRPEHDSVKFPWDDAANTVPPLLWTKVSSVTSKFVQSILNKDPMFVYESSDDEYTPHAGAITRHIKDIINDPNQGAFRRSVWPLEFDKASFGTVFVKVPFELEKRIFSRMNKETGGVEKVEQLIRSCPKPYVIPFEDFLTRPQWGDLQKAPWIAVRTYKYFHQLQALETAGYYTNLENIWGRNETLDENKVEKMSNIGITQSDSSEELNHIYKIFEVNMFFDVSGQGIPEDIIIHYEAQSNTILRVEYNELGRRDIVRIPYVELAQILYGMGVGDMTSSLQEMIETVFNTSFNSDELSYMGVILTRQGSGIEYGENIYPGAVVPVPDPSNDVKMLQFPSATMQSMALEQKIMGYADQATGANNMMVGQENQSQGNRIGATGTQFLAAQGNAYLEAFLELAVNGYQEIGELMLLQLVRNSDNVSLDQMSESDRVLLREVYSTPVEDINKKFRFSISMADIQQETRERQQALVQLFQLYGAFMDKITQYTTVMSNPQLGQPGFERLQEVMMTAFVGMNKIFERLLENFNEKEIADFLPYYKDMELVLEGMDKSKDEVVESVRTESNQEAAAAFKPGSDNTSGFGSAPVVEAGPTASAQESPTGLQGPSEPVSPV